MSSSVFKKIQNDLESISKAWNVQGLPVKIQQLTQESMKENFWSNTEEAAQVMKNKALYESQLAAFTECSEELELLESEENENFLLELAKKVETHKLRSLFNTTDELGCFLEVRAGAGGTEANDWASMLFNMYTRYAQNAGYKVEIIDEVAAEPAGIVFGVLKVLPSSSATHPYGFLKNESGPHRLVRISPFDSNASRHTSFAGIDVVPVVDKTITIDILDKDLEIKSCRASGAGGQHVNKTNSAVRVVHTPTGIVAESQQERSYHQNLSHAMSLLKSRIYAMELKKQQECEQKRLAARGDITWSNQIRSYVLQPYQSVKDHQTGHNESNALRVLEGHIQGFLDAAVVWSLEGQSDQK